MTALSPSHDVTPRLASREEAGHHSRRAETHVSEGVASWPRPSLSPHQPFSPHWFPALHSSDVARCPDNRQTPMEGFPRRWDGERARLGVGSDGSQLEITGSPSSPPAGWGGLISPLLLFFSSSHPLFVLLFHLFLVPLHLFDVPAVKTGSYQLEASLWLQWLFA